MPIIFKNIYNKYTTMQQKRLQSHTPIVAFFNTMQVSNYEFDYICDIEINSLMYFYYACIFDLLNLQLFLYLCARLHIQTQQILYVFATCHRCDINEVYIFFLLLFFEGRKRNKLHVGS